MTREELYRVVRNLRRNERVIFPGPMSQLVKTMGIDAPSPPGGWKSVFGVPCRENIVKDIVTIGWDL